jgi:hypothetical protein
MCTLLVTETVACLVSEGEFSCFLMYTLLVRQTMACLVSVGELACFVMCNSSGDRDYGLFCFSW